MSVKYLLGTALFTVGFRPGDYQRLPQGQFARYQSRLEFGFDLGREGVKLPGNLQTLASDAYRFDAIKHGRHLVEVWFFHASNLLRKFFGSGFSSVQNGLSELTDALDLIVIFHPGDPLVDAALDFTDVTQARGTHGN